MKITVQTTAHDEMYQEYVAREEGYVYVFVSNENPTLVEVYFDDVTVTITPGSVIQANEYYPYGLQTATSWTRDNSVGNNFLYNGGTELNKTTQVYDLYYRNYDPVLGRFGQVDPMASKYGPVSPYHFAGNNPVVMNDPMGDDYGDNNYLDTWYNANIPKGPYTAGSGSSVYRDMDPSGRATTARFYAQHLELISYHTEAGFKAFGESTEALSEETLVNWNRYNEDKSRGPHIWKKGTKVGNLLRRIGAVLKGIFGGNEPQLNYTTFEHDDLDKAQEYMRSKTKESNQMVVGLVANGHYIILPTGSNTETDWDLDEVVHRVKKGHLQLKIDGSWVETSGLLLAFPRFDAFFVMDYSEPNYPKQHDFYHSREKGWRNQSFKEYGHDYLYIFSDTPLGIWGKPVRDWTIFIKPDGL